MFAVAGLAIDDWNSAFVAPPSNAAAEASRQTHQVRIVEVVVRAVEVTPPDAKAPRSLRIREVGIDRQAFDAVVHTIEPRRVMLAEGIRAEQRRFWPAPSLGFGLGARRR